MKQKLFKISLASILILSGCRASGESITGTYKSKTHNFVAQCYLHFFLNTRYVVGSTLEIKADSTYHLQNCGNIIDGKWQIGHDSLFLFCESNRWRMDSFNKTGFNGEFLECKHEPQIFFIDKGLLKQKLQLKGRTVLNYFVKDK